MPRRGYKSRTFRRLFKKLPGGTTKLTYKRRKPSKAVCSNCGDVLKGVPNKLPYKMKRLPLTKKRPERPFGGVLCSKCVRDKIKEKILS
ncbi:50S ribosomal protein L34e [Candidatus Woesearchaeota archaeon]|nr:50S ribosomal protein L34e [Candidatus Woesearchaeota archaeon]